MAQDSLTRLLQIDLQLFAEEKTEKATPRKRQKARQKGQVLKSMELNSALVLLAAFLSLKIFTPYMMEQFAGYFQETSRLWGSRDFSLTAATSQQLYLSAIIVSIKIVVPLAGFTIISGVAANLLQTGFMLSGETLKPKLSNLNPIQGLKKMVGLRAIVDLVKSMIKVAIVGYIAYSTYSAEFYNFPQMLDMNIKVSAVYIGQLILTMGFKIGFCLIVLAGFDYIYQWWEYEKNLKMGKQEIKDEHKMQEGDPKVKSAIRRKQQQMSVARMMQMVPKADVVITNPTHFAVALKYDTTAMDAPEVIAKGQDFLAQKIKDIAKEHKVTLVENKPLAQALFKQVEVGQTIPGDLYQAVAEVLAFVYKLKGKI